MFRKGDLVRYGQSGVCCIEEIQEMSMGTEKQEYYVLRPLFKTGTVYVPCLNLELSRRMLPLLTAEEIDGALKKARETEAFWIRDFRSRSEFCKKALSSGDRTDALILIKNYYHHRNQTVGEGKRLHTSDDYFLRDAEQLVFHEFSYVLGKDYEEVAREVREQIGAES